MHNAVAGTFALMLAMLAAPASAATFSAFARTTLQVTDITGGPSPDADLVFTEVRPARDLVATYETPATGTFYTDDSYDPTMGAQAMMLEAEVTGTVPARSRIIISAGYNFSRLYIENTSASFAYDIGLTGTLEIDLETSGTTADFAEYLVGAYSRIVMIRFDGVTGDSDKILSANTFQDKGAPLDEDGVESYDARLRVLPGSDAEIWIGAVTGGNINFGPVPEVPLPASLWLLGSALLVLGPLRRLTSPSKG